MAKYIVDTNVFLRFLLKDNEEYFKKARRYFLQAKKHQITLILLPVVVLEINDVLKEVILYPARKRKDFVFFIKIAIDGKRKKNPN